MNILVKVVDSGAQGANDSRGSNVLCMSWIWSPKEEVADIGSTCPTLYPPRSYPRFTVRERKAAVATWQTSCAYSTVAAISVHEQHDFSIPKLQVPEEVAIFGVHQDLESRRSFGKQAASGRYLPLATQKEARRYVLDSLSRKRDLWHGHRSKMVVVVTVTEFPIWLCLPKPNPAHIQRASIFWSLDLISRIPQAGWLSSWRAIKLLLQCRTCFFFPKFIFSPFENVPTTHSQGISHSWMSSRINWCVQDAIQLVCGF